MQAIIIISSMKRVFSQIRQTTCSKVKSK